MTFSVAPMMKWTDKHCRFFHRTLTKKSIIFSEMISVDAIIHGPKFDLLSANFCDDMTVIQVGGSDPVKMGLAAKEVEKFGYSEINLNIGCPSNRVKSGNFGACLMASPTTVSNCVKEILDKTNLKVSIKCRIGIDNMADTDLDEFIAKTAESGVKKFIIHARKAMLNGISPKQNREIPPLNYSRVKKLKMKFKNLKFILNGGICSIDNGIDFINKYDLDGFMIGRKAYQNPYILSTVDNRVFKGLNTNLFSISRRDVAHKLADYVDKYLFDKNDFLLIRHILGLYKNMPGSKRWKNDILKKNCYNVKGDKIRFATDKIEKIISKRGSCLTGE